MREINILDVKIERAKCTTIATAAKMRTETMKLVTEHKNIEAQLSSTTDALTQSKRKLKNAMRSMDCLKLQIQKMRPKYEGYFGIEQRLLTIQNEKRKLRAKNKALFLQNNYGRKEFDVLREKYQKTQF